MTTIQKFQEKTFSIPTKVHLGSPKEITQLADFVSSAIIGVGKAEYYNLKEEQKEALLNIHKPILEKFRNFYALSLLMPINRLNKQIVMSNLLKYGKNISSKVKKSEDILIFQTLSNMTFIQALRAWKTIQENKVNNIRTRRLADKFLGSRDNLVFESLKYKKSIKKLIIHNHLKSPTSAKEIFEFLFGKKKTYLYSIFNDYHKAKENKEAMFRLPLTIAIGFNNKFHHVDQKSFLEKMKGKMTTQEKFLFQEKAKREKVKIKVDFSKYDLRKLLLYLRVAEKKPREMNSIIKNALKKVTNNISFNFKKVRVVLDNSASSYGSKEKKYHPIATAQAISLVLNEISEDFKEYRVHESSDILAPCVGASNMAIPLIKALKDKPEAIFILSDGYENQPAGACEQITKIFKEKFDKENKVKIYHFGTTFAAETEKVRSLGESISSVGIRNVEEIGVALLLNDIKEGGKKLETYMDKLLDSLRIRTLRTIPYYLLAKPK